MPSLFLKARQYVDCRILRHPIFRGLMAVMGGTVVAQVVPVLMSPIISRLYTPDTLGMLGIFTSIASMITPFITLAYAYAIVLPSDEKDAWELFKLSLHICLAIVLLCSLPFVFFRTSFARMIQTPSIAVFLPFLIPVLLFAGYEQTVRQWMIRKRSFKIIGFVIACSAIVATLSKAAVGIFRPTIWALMILTLIVTLFRGFLLYYSSRRCLPKSESFHPDAKARSKLVAKRYQDFPKYRSPQLLLNGISQNIPILLLAAFFNPAEVGLYALSQRVLKMPLSVISSSLGQVLLPHMAATAQNKISLRPQLLRATTILGLIGFIPILVLFVFGPQIFRFVFGENWLQAGHYARWISPWLFLMFMNVPCVQAIPIIGLQKELLLFESCSFVIRTLALLIGGLIFQDTIKTIILLSFSNVIVYTFLIVSVISLSDRRIRE